MSSPMWERLHHYSCGFARRCYEHSAGSSSIQSALVKQLWWAAPCEDFPIVTESRWVFAKCTSCTRIVLRTICCSGVCIPMVSRHKRRSAMLWHMHWSKKAAKQALLRGQVLPRKVSISEKIREDNRWANARAKMISNGEDRCLRTHQILRQRSFKSIEVQLWKNLLHLLQRQNQRWTPNYSYLKFNRIFLQTLFLKMVEKLMRRP